MWNEVLLSLFWHAITFAVNFSESFDFPLELERIQSIKYKKNSVQDEMDMALGALT